MYLAAEWWKGAFKVSTVRSFKTEQEAKDYIREKGFCFFRVYKVSSDEPPVLVWTYERRVKEGEEFVFPQGHWVKVK